MPVLIGPGRLAPRLLTMLTLLGVGACAPALNWRAFTLEAGEGLQVNFPCKPDRIERPLSWPESGEAVVVRMHHCQAEGLTWVLQSVAVDDLGKVDPILRAWPAVLADNLRQATLGAVVEVHPPEEIEVPRMTPNPLARAVDLAAAPPSGVGQAGAPAWRRVRAWHFSHGLRVYEAAVWSIEDHKPAQTSEDVTLPFFEGLQFPG
jgi:hypothetical protein